MSVVSPIVVGVRVRPFNQRESRFQSECVIGMDSAGNVRLFQVNNGKPSLSQPPREFSFDHAFWTHDRATIENQSASSSSAQTQNGGALVFADQGYVYEKMAAPVLSNVLSGFNACLFAYGQTGSGKTYSMMGTPSDRGVLPRLGEAMFAEILNRKQSEQTLCAVEASFCEIYNEKVRDLMANESSSDGPSLPIRMDPKKGIFVEGLSKFAVTNADDFYIFLEKGLSSRATASTNMNNTSSRSHAVVIIVVSQTGPKGEKCGKLCLVDLAGSERVAATGATGQTAAEGQSINLSLTQLGICLKRLAEQAEAAVANKKQTNALPIPYRDSSLTFLLKENLGGNSRTAMLANISPASVNYDETLATLRFASIARKVKSMATVNENPQTKLILQLRQELAQLREKFQMLEARKSLSLNGGITSQVRESVALPEIRSRTASPNAVAPVSLASTVNGGQALLIKSTSPSVELPSMPPQVAVSELGDVVHPEIESPLSPTVEAVSQQPPAARPDSIVLTDSDTDDLEEEIRSIEAIRHQTKSFVFHHTTSNNNNNSASMPNASMAASPSFRFPGLQLNLAKLSMARAATPPQHDTDLDELMTQAVVHSSNEKQSHRRGSNVRGSCNASAVNIDQNNNGSFTLETSKKSFTNMSMGGSTGDVFIDAQKPQFIHLNPDVVTNAGSSSGSDIPLVMVLEEGENSFDVSGANVVLFWDALVNQVTIFSTPGAVVVNGEIIEDEGCILRHRDRVVIVGELAFRFSFAAGVVAQEGGFNKTPTCVDHLLQLERYFRYTILLERSRDAMSIAKSYLYQLSMFSFGGGSRGDALRRHSADEALSQVTVPKTSPRRSVVNVTRLRNSVRSPRRSIDLDDDDDDLIAAGCTPRVTPRSNDPIIAAIGDDIAMFNELVYKVEVDLADMYPPPPQALLDLDDPREAITYAEAINEARKNHEEQEKELEWLRSQVHGVEVRLGREASVFLHTPGASHTKKERSLSRIFGSTNHHSLYLDHDHENDNETFSEALGEATIASVGEDTPTASANVSGRATAVAPLVVANTVEDSPQVTVTASPNSRNNNILAMGPESVVFEQRIADQLTTRIVQLELSYHRKVRALQTFSPTGPKAPADKDHWDRLGSNPPFLGDPSLQCEQSCYCSIRDHNASNGSWIERFVSSSCTFLYVFKKADGRERSMTALYIPGAQTASLNDTDIEVCPSCPRNDKDTKSNNSKDAALVFRFKTTGEKLLWLQWFQQNSITIAMPHHMLKRVVEERAQQYAKDELYADAFTLSNSNAHAVLNDVCKTANWKPDETSNACESCSKPFSFFNRRHHCRVCGGIFCSNCCAKDPRIGNELSCAVCREEQLGSPRGGNASTGGKGALMSKQRSKKELRSSTTISAAASPSSAASSSAMQAFCVIVRSTLIPQLERLVEDLVVRIDGDRNAQRLRIDHYQGRLHTTLADDILNVARCPTTTTRLFVRIKHSNSAGLGGSHSPPSVAANSPSFSGMPLLAAPSSANFATSVVKVIQFDNALCREHCYESIVVLMNQRVFINTLGPSRRIAQFVNADVVVQDDEEVEDDDDQGAEATSLTSLIRTTTRGLTERSIWAGIESSRSIPFHHKHSVYFVVGYQESWSERQLEAYGLFLLSTIRMGRKMPTLYVIVDRSLRNAVMGAPWIAPVVNCGKNVALTAVGVQLQETTLCVVMTNHYELVATHQKSASAPTPPQNHQDPEQADLGAASVLHLERGAIFESNVDEGDAPPFLLKNLKFSQLPPVDVTQFFDHVVLIGAPHMDEFNKCSSADSYLVQCRSASASTAVAKKAGKSWAQLHVDVFNYHVAKFSSTMEQRPLIMLRSALITLYDAPTTTDSAAAPVDITSQCSLWGNFGYDRFDSSSQAIVVVDSFSMLLQEERAAGVQPPQPPLAESAAVLRTLLVANTMPEYFKARSVYISGGTYGSCVVPVAALYDGADTTVHLEAVYEGRAVGVVSAVFQQEWV